MDWREKEAWICFSAFTPIGPKRFRVLRDYFGSARKAWQASKEKLLGIGFSEKLVSDFEKFRKAFDLSLYQKGLEKLKIKTIGLEDKEYPENLKPIEDAPFLLYVLGELKTVDSLAVGVVGTRKITSYGKQVTESLVTDLVVSGLTIVSGMAYGVDCVAHSTALDMSGRTIGVWAGGLDTVLSGFRQNLVRRIIESGQGAIISEFPLGFPPNRSTFPQRNRIIAGLSLGVLVTEAAEDSGSLITASQANKYGRKVFAVPGPITSILSKGTSELIKNGAILVSQTSDILEEVEIEKKREGEKAREILPENEEEKAILDLLENETKHIDEIVRETGMAIAKVAGLLTLMEMKGKVKNLGGMIYALCR